MVSPEKILENVRARATKVLLGENGARRGIDVKQLDYVVSIMFNSIIFFSR